jgi:hypothetical protein
MWTSAVTTDVARQEMDNKLEWANDQRISRLAMMGNRSTLGALRRALGRAIVEIGEWIQGSMIDHQVEHRATM